MRLLTQLQVDGDDASVGTLESPLMGGASALSGSARVRAVSKDSADVASRAPRRSSSRTVADPSEGEGQDGAHGVPGTAASRHRSRTRQRAIVIACALAAAALVGIACWQYVPGLLAWLADASAVRAFVADHAFLSRLAMLGINMAQVLLAFLPGEPVELASGYAFGFIEGTCMCLIAAALATTMIYWGVRRWGWGLVGLFFDRATFDRFSWLQDAKRLELVMLVVFLIPGTPKDFLTYFAGLTGMRFAPVVLIATFGRLPSIITSTIAASAFGSGNYGIAVLATVASFAMLAVGGALYKLVRERSGRTA